MTTHENIGTPVQAIEFALKIDDHYDMRDFLGSWNEGDLTDWPEFLKHINPQPVDPAWIKSVALEVEERGPVDRYNCAVNALHLALSLGHVVLAPVMPSEEEMLRDAREDAAQVAEGRGKDHWATATRSGNDDECYDVQCALQARRNVYASLGAVAGKAASSGPVVPEVDLRGSLNKAWEAGAKSVRDVVHRHIQALMPNVGTEAARVADVSAILESLKSGEA